MSLKRLNDFFLKWAFGMAPAPAGADACGLSYEIRDIDGPEDLVAQAPLHVRLLRRLPGPDSPNYWLSELRVALSWKQDGSERRITHVVVGERLQGTQFGRDRELPVNVACVTDSTLLDDEHMHFEKAAYVAIGMAREL